MGRTHALSGATAFAAVAPLVSANVPTMVLGASVCIGATLLPDLDHESSTVSRSLGWITGGFSWLMRVVSGGHRRGTHSALGILVLGIGCQMAVSGIGTLPGAIGTGIYLTLCWASVARLVSDTKWDDWLAIPAAAGVVGWYRSGTLPVDLDAIPPAVVVGCLVHVLGDIITKQGCPVLWPLSDTPWKLALFRAGGPFEYRVMTPALFLLTGWFIFVWIN